MAVSQQSVLVIEEEQAVQNLISRILHAQGFGVFCATNREDALSLYEQEAPDLVILDLNLPDRDRVELYRCLRRHSPVPLILLGTMDSGVDRLMGEGIGVNEYLIKPFSPEELMIHVRALLHQAGKSAASAADPLRFGDLIIDFHNQRLLRAAREVHLTRTEWALLKELTHHAGKILTHRMLLHRVWGDAYDSEVEYLHTYISRLRRKLEEEPARPRYLLTEPRIGYYFAPPVQEEGRHSPRPPAVAPPPRVNQPEPLPVQLTSFIGRDQLVATISQALRQPEIRLLTLIGPPGTGKSRLALQVAMRLLEEPGQRAFFVDLAPIHNPALVRPTIARTLGIKEEGLLQSLRSAPCLLILDNFEQVVRAAPLISDLLAVAPALKVLVTSRSVLHLYGEHTFPVPPLAMPPLSPLPPLDRLGQVEAVRLFVERARAVRADFELTAENGALIGEICHRLDGLPLAIELAAACIRLLSPQAMLARLESRLALLTGGGRNLPERQRTLRGAMDWSYDLLDPTQQSLFEQLAIFVGGATLDAIEAICTPSNDGPFDLLQELAALVDNSLLRQIEREDGEPRFVMLDTIREYALERLQARRSLQPLQHRHVTYYLTLAEEAEPRLLSAQQALWLQRLEEEAHNFRAALQSACEREEWEVASRLAGALWRFWYMRGHRSEGQRWLESILPRSGPLSISVRVKLLHGLGTFVYLQGEYRAASKLWEEAMALYRSLGDQEGIAILINNLGLLAYAQGNYERARTLLEESLALAQELGGALFMVDVSNNLALVVLEQGDYERATKLLEEGLALRRRLGMRWGAALSLTNLGAVAAAQGELEQARTYLEASLALWRELDDRQTMAETLVHLGWVNLQQGDRITADACFREGLSLRCASGDRRGLISAMEGFAAILATKSNQAEEAARLLGAAEQLREEIGLPLRPSDRPRHGRTLARLRARLGEEALATVWAAGQQSPIEPLLDRLLAARAPGSRLPARQSALEQP